MTRSRKSWLAVQTERGLEVRSKALGTTHYRRSDASGVRPYPYRIVQKLINLSEGWWRRCHNWGKRPCLRLRPLGSLLQVGFFLRKRFGILCGTEPFFEFLGACSNVRRTTYRRALLTPRSDCFLFFRFLLRPCYIALLHLAGMALRFTQDPDSLWDSSFYLHLLLKVWNSPSSGAFFIQNGFISSQILYYKTARGLGVACKIYSKKGRIDLKRIFHFQYLKSFQAIKNLYFFAYQWAPANGWS